MSESYCWPSVIAEITGGVASAGGVTQKVRTPSAPEHSESEAQPSFVQTLLLQKLLSRPVPKRDRKDVSDEESEPVGVGEEGAL